MAVTNLLKPQVDLPVFEWMRFAPVANSTGVCTTISSDGRYIYYLIPGAGPTFYRYDTYTDSWQELQGPVSNVLSTASIQYSVKGNRGPVLSATSTTLKIAGIDNKSMVGMTVNIVGGKGAGQSRTITAVSDLIIHDSGVASSIASSNNVYGIIDNTKKWRVNQWVGYSLRPVMNTGTGNLRKIIYNSTTGAYNTDPGYQLVDPWNGPAVWASTGISNFPTATAPATQYQIESIDLTIDSPWTELPDSSSVFEIQSGTVWLSVSSTIGFGIMYCYDVLTNVWYFKATMHTHINSSLATDISAARVPVGITFISGVTATSAAAYNITTSGATMEYDRYANHEIFITSGKGIGQSRRVVGNSNTTFYVDKKWGVTPDSTSVYSVALDDSKIWLTGNGSSALYYYDIERNSWGSSHIVDHGTAKQISLLPYAGASYEYPYSGIPATAITYNASGVVSVSVGTTTGVNYQVGDLLVLNNAGSGGTGARVYVTGVTGAGLVTSLSIANSGFTYSGSTSSVSGGSGSGLIVSYTSGKVGNIFTGITHNFFGGLTLTIAGCTTDTTFNNNLRILGVGDIFSISVAADASAAASPTAFRTQSTAQIVDASKNWDANEHRGRMIHMYGTNNSNGSSALFLGSRKIATNTSTSIVWEGTALTTPTNGLIGYIIAEPKGFGAAQQYKEPTKASYGWATSGTATTLTDTSKNWIPGMFVNCRIRVMSGTGMGNESVITANTTNTVTVASWANATPDATSKYEILDTFGIATSAGTSTTTFTDTAKNWQTNYLAGKRIRFITGAGFGNEFTINTNTATTLTLASTATFEAVAANGTQYVIYEVPVKGAGCFAQVLHSLSDSAKKGRLLFTARGGASAYFDLYDIPTNTYKSLLYGGEPAAATLSTGSMYAYDGADRIIFTKDATGRLYSVNCVTGQITASTITPYAHGTAVIGNRMEVVSTTDGLKYLYLMRHSGLEMWRTLVFWS
jgi:hypothetical protein